MHVFPRHKQTFVLAAIVNYVMNLCAKEERLIQLNIFPMFQGKMFYDNNNKFNYVFLLGYYSVSHSGQIFNIIKTAKRVRYVMLQGDGGGGIKHFGFSARRYSLFSSSSSFSKLIRAECKGVNWIINTRSNCSYFVFASFLYLAFCAEVNLSEINLLVNVR